jgi:hypothetical protein
MDQVRTRKEQEWARGTHFLESAKGGTSPGAERKRAGQGNSPTIEAEGGTSQDGERKGRTRSTHILSSAGREGQVRTAKEREQARGTHWHGLESAEGHVRIPRTANEQGALTFWRAQREGQVRTRRESERVKCTHQLESEERGRSQDC